MADPLNSWQEEKQSAYLYRVLSEVEKGTPNANLFSLLAEAAERQSEIWIEQVRASGSPLPDTYRPDIRARLVAAVLRWLGPRPMLPVLAAMKIRGLSVYSTSHDSLEMKRHRSLAGGANLRAAVFGVNDGLLSNMSLILGVAGASSDTGVVLLSGMAGLLAGAFSMSAGEYVSVRSQRELFEYQIGLEREELEEYPKEEARELALIYEARGLSPTEAKTFADKIIADPKKALDILAREELGINPNDLGSPWGAAISSFFSFSLGAFIPLIPFLFIQSDAKLMLSVLFAAVSLFAVGSVLSLFTGRNALIGGLRMLSIGTAAGGITYVIGRWVGVSLT